MSAPATARAETPADRPGAEPEPANLRAELREARSELDRLYAALDNVQSGLLILDREFRAVYSNPVLHTMFKSYSAGKIRKERPPYAKLLRDAQSAAAVLDFDDYVARRLDWVRSGDTAPVDLKMSDGRVLRCHLAVLPDGGRMLIYSDVTDIVRNAQELERLATTDGMTGIYNRRHFLVLADREWVRARRYQRPLSLLMFDIDRFKTVNDRFGHPAGDEVIVHLAALASRCKRDSDVLARVGGEEFALLLPDTPLAKAALLGERLRNAVSRMPLTGVAPGIGTTVSVGVATADETMAEFSKLMSAADRALYDAKRAGRNRVCCAAA
jgi:diguanylate cyclase (GGDEF)-like protein